MLQAIAQSLAEQLPVEPPPECKDDVSTVRVRVPQQKDPLVRRFLAHNTLQTLLDYVTSQGYHTQDYKLLTTFPRKDVRSIISYIRISHQLR